MKIIGYVRLSRASREESTSITRQREVIEAACYARGFKLVGLVEDVDVSATRSRLDRPGLHEVRRRIAEKEADAVMVWRLDRLVRSVSDVGVLLDEGLQIVSATESLDTTSAMGRAMVEILQVFASMEAKTTGLRVSASQAHLRRVGRFPGGVIPYGYRAVAHPDGVGRALAIAPDEARIVRRMADEALAGRSVYSIAVGLNRDGVPPRRSEKWSTTSIQRILRSDTVLGRVKSGGELRRSDVGVPLAVWEPILRVEEVEQLRFLTEWTPTPGRAAATTEALRRTRASRSLSGLLICPSCSRPLHARTRAKARDIYACRSVARGLDCPRGIAIECERVEAEVERQFLAVVGRSQVVEPRRRSREIVGLAATDEAIRATTDQLRAPDADFTALVSRLESLRQERARIMSTPREAVVEMVETGDTFADVWARNDAHERRSLLLGVGVSIEVRPARQRGAWDPSRVTVHFPLWEPEVDLD